MANQNLVGRCDLYCGACGIYRAYKDGDEYLKRIADQFKCPPGKVKCEGCQALAPGSWGYDCKIVQCLRAKGLEFCYQCNQHVKGSCEKFGKLAEGYAEDSVDLRANLELIRKGEAEKWLRESEKRFKCPKCGKFLSVDAIKRKCYHCGADLSKSS